MKQRFTNKLLMVFSMAILSNYAIAQRTITGTVTGADDNSPLPGVTVLEKGTSNGTVSNVEGKYSLRVTTADPILVFSFVGFAKKEIAVRTSSVIDASLDEDVQSLSEVVVVGYGTQKKANLTGSVASVEMDNIESIPTGNSGSVLQGRLPGVTVSNFSAQPGNDNPQIRIRGIGTFNSGAEPLVIVDGVQSQLNQVPVSDIKSVTVLKDAASAAIYGVRAANGVIIVTTKRGDQGKTKVSLRSNVAFQNPIVRPDFLEAYDWAQIRNEWTVADGGTPVYTDAQLEAIRSGSSPDEFANTDWWEEAFRTGVMQTHHVSVSGGAEKVKYMISGEWLDQEGILKGTDANRASLRANLDVDVSDKLKVGLNAYGFKRKINEPSVYSASSFDDNSLIYSIRRFTQPTVPVQYANGKYGFVDGAHPDQGMIIRNPLWAVNTGFSETDRNRIEAKVFAAYELVDGLSFKSSLANIYVSTLNSRFIPTYQQYNSEGTVVLENVNNSLSNSNTTFNRRVFENLITYNQQFGVHSFGGLLGHTAQYERNDYMYAYIQNFPNNNIHELGGGVTNPQVDGNAYEVALQSFFGRINYAFADKYLLEVNMRYDGSSRMPASSRYGLFPSFSAGWVLSNESFLSGSSFISFLKLRGSWGQLGNQEIGNYSFVQNIGTGADYLIGGGVAGGVSVNDLANSSIKWETTTITDFGIDLNLFDDRLQVVADYFNKRSSDILIRLPIPATLGVNNGPYQNVAEVVNQGWEADVRYRNNLGEFNYFAGFNISKVRNEITDIAGLEDWISGNTINMVGQPIGAYYGYVAEGYFEEGEIADHATQWGTLRPGDIKYKDISGPEGVPDGQITAEYDRQIIGNPFPEFSYAFNLGADFKGFDLNMFFQGVHGIERFFWYNTENIGQFTSSIKDHWTEENTDAAYPRFGNSANNYAMSTFWLRDASYLRLKNLELGYTLPAALTESIGIQHVRFYFVGNNLLTFTEVEEYDPERPSGDDRNRSYPGSKAYSFGVNLTF